MFFVLSKILTFLLSPFNWCLILLLLTFFSRSDKQKKRLKIIYLLVFVIFSNTWIFQKIISQWEYPITNIQLVNNNKPVVVLGGFSSYVEHADRIHFNDASDRLLQALLYHKSSTPNKLIISGGSAEIYFDEKPESEFVKDYLINIGIDKEDIIIENKSRNTYENALYTSHLMDSLLISKDIILVTSAFHMKRAKACFVKQGFNVDSLSAHSFTIHKPLKPGDYLLPSLTTLQRWAILNKEWMGIVVYKLKGYI